MSAQGKKSATGKSCVFFIDFFVPKKIICNFGTNKNLLALKRHRDDSESSSKYIHIYFSFSVVKN